MELLASIAVRPDCSVVIVTHDDRIFRFAHVIHSMSDGRIIGSERRERPNFGRKNRSGLQFETASGVPCERSTL